MIGEMSPSAIAAELGQRLKQARLNQNVTQEELAEHIGITRKMVKNAERGQVTLEMFVTIMDGLSLTENLDLFLPEQLVSPIQLAKMQGRRRRRASPSTNKSEQQDKEGASW